MKKILLVIAIVAVLLPLAACGVKVVNKSVTGNQRIIKQEVPNVAYFNKIESNASVDIKFVQDNKNGVTLRGTKQLLDKIIVKVDEKNKSLLISVANNSRLITSDMDDAEVLVSSPDLNSVSLFGAGDFESERSLKTNELKVEVNGAGDIDFKRLDCDKVYFTLNGAGDIDVDALKANYTDININGAGDVDVDFVNSGDVKCSLYGAGNVELSGKVKTLSQNVHGAGNIETYKLIVGK